MAILSRPKISPQQRLDLEDWNALLAAARTDSLLWNKQFLSANNLILKGFTITGLGLKEATVNMADATLIVPQSTTDFSWFTSSPTEPNVTITDAQLTDGVRNYVEIELLTEDNTPLTKAFWDPEANGGAGAEFNNIVNTITDLKTNFVVLTGGFSGSADRIPLAIIDTDGAGNIKLILDERKLFARLAQPNNIDNDYSWGTKQEPVYSLVMTGVSGTFQAGETITIGGETATVVTGGTTNITFNVPSGRSFANGNSVTGGTSGATGTVDTILESFTGVDKSTDTIKELFDAMMTEIKAIKGTRFWWQDANQTLQGITSFLDSVVVQAVVDAQWSWDGTNFQVTDDSGTPADADGLAYLRRFGKTGDLTLTRQDGTGGSANIPVAEGQVVFIKVPETGSRTYTGVGVSDTNYQVVNLADYVSSDENYWLAYREQGLLYVRGYGELASGESTPISDPDKETILALIAALNERSNEDRTAKLVKGGTWSWDLGNNRLTWSAAAFVQMAGLAENVNEIAAGNVVLPSDGQCAYVTLKRTAGASTLTVTVADIASVPLTDDNMIIARRNGDVVVVGESFQLKDDEYLELDGALAEINRLLGQLRITAHETDADKARVSAADVSLLNGHTLSQVIGNFLLDLDGAVVDFTTGSIFKADGSTPLGINFTPQTIPVGEYFWYGLALIPSTLNANNTQQAQVQVTLAASSNVVQASAPLPTIIGTIKLGAVQVQNNAGSIELVDVRRLGVGSGSGGTSAGNANSFLETLKNRLNDSIFESATPYIAETDQEDTALIDAASTGSFDFVSERFEIDSGQTLQSANLLDTDFQSKEIGVNQAEVLVKWDENGLDTAATYEISRNGGNEWQALTMERVADSFTYRGFHTFATEAANQTVTEYALSNLDSAVSFDAGSAQARAQQFTIANFMLLREVNLSMDRDGTPGGTVKVQIVKDNAGVPSTAPADVVAESNPLATGDIATSLTTTAFAVNAVLPPATYHIVLVTDAAYKSGFVNPTDRISVGIDGSTPPGPESDVFNGTSWATSPGTQIVYEINGIEYDLRLRVTASANDKLIEGFGVLFEENIGDLAIPTTVDGITRVSFNAVADNTNEFTLPFLPNPDLLAVHLLGSGQVFRYGDFNLQGNTVIFADDQFNNNGVEKVQTLMFDQIRGGAFDNSDRNAALMAANGLGSTDGSIDQSSPGQGRIQQRPDATKVEVTVNDLNDVEIYVVTP